MTTHGLLITGTSDHSTLIPSQAAARKDGGLILHLGVDESSARTNTVADPHPVWESMRQRWALINALMGGTLTMRAWTTEFLPKETAESDDAYSDRLRRTFLFNGLESAIRSIVSKPFSRDVVGDSSAGVLSLEGRAAKSRARILAVQSRQRR